MLLAVEISAKIVWPTFAMAQQTFLKQWSRQFPIPIRPQQIQAAPQARGLLCAKLQNAPVCYYRFRVQFSQPQRPINAIPAKAEQPSEIDIHKKASQTDVKKVKYNYNQMRLKPARQGSAWLQCHYTKLNRKQSGCRWRIYFMRSDLLPGRAKYWYKQ